VAKSLSNHSVISKSAFLSDYHLQTTGISRYTFLCNQLAVRTLPRVRSSMHQGQERLKIFARRQQVKLAPQAAERSTQQYCLGFIIHRYPSPNQLLYMNQCQYPLPTADDARLAHVIWDKLAQVAIGELNITTLNASPTQNVWNRPGLTFSTTRTGYQTTQRKVDSFG